MLGGILEKIKTVRLMAKGAQAKKNYFLLEPPKHVLNKLIRLY